MIGIFGKVTDMTMRVKFRPFFNTLHEKFWGRKINLREIEKQIERWEKKKLRATKNNAHKYQPRLNHLQQKSSETIFDSKHFSYFGFLSDFNSFLSAFNSFLSAFNFISCSNPFYAKRKK